jgi:hypothetical protein
MSTRYTSCLALQSGFLNLRGIGKHVAASEWQQRRSLTRYAHVPYLIFFPLHIVHFVNLMHFLILRTDNLALKYKIFSKVHQSALFVLMCTYCTLCTFCTLFTLCTHFEIVCALKCILSAHDNVQCCNMGWQASFQHSFMPPYISQCTA